MFTNVHTNSYAQLTRAVVLPNVVVERNARLTNVVIDRGVRIPDGLVIGEDSAADAEFFHVSDGGVTLVTAPMVERWKAAQ